MCRLNLETVLLIVIAAPGLFAARACADDAVSADARVHETAAQESPGNHRAKVHEEKKTLPPWFPGRLVPASTTGLRLKSLEIFGAAGKPSGLPPKVGYRAEFVCGPDEIARQAWESPVEIFMITHDERTHEQKVDSSQPILRVYAGQPARVTYMGTTELPGKDHGSWVTVIVIGRNSSAEAARLLANQTKYVDFASAGEESRTGTEGRSEPDQATRGLIAPHVVRGRPTRTHSIPTQSCSHL